MTEVLTIVLAALAALVVIGGVVWFSLRMSDRKALRSARGAAQGTPALNNEWVALNGDSGSASSDCAGAGGGCD